jgi:hypothetical protein
MKNTAYIPRKQNVELPPPKNPFVNGIFRYAGYLNELGEAFVHPMHAAFTAINPKWTGMAHKVVDATYKAVFAYTCMDAAYSGAQAYFRARQDGNSEKMAAMKGLQAGVGQGIFQLLASYYVPAEIIKRVFNPMGTKLGMMLGKTKTMGTVGGTALSLLAIPLMVKVVDPLSEKLVHALWTKPTNRFLERRDQGEVARSFHAPHKANAAVL